MSKTWIWRDIGYTAIVTPTENAPEHVMDVRVHEIADWGREGPSYRTKGDCNLFAASVENAEVFLEGFVRWDGCSNWNFEAYGTWIHFCGKQKAIDLGVLLGRLYDVAKDFIPAADPTSLE